MRVSFLSLFPLLVAGGSSALTAQMRDSVWVNSRSGVYHCPGTEFYGKTTRGSYMSEGDALRAGHRGNGGRRCHPAPELAVESIAGAGGTQTEEPRNPTGPTEACKVTRITDGDTFHCEPFGGIRPIGIDTPEKGEPAFWQAARAALAQWLPVGATVRLERDTRPTIGDRKLAYVWHDGRMINWLMVRHGWAASTHYPPDTRYAAALDAAESLARQEQRGFWVREQRPMCFSPQRKPGLLCPRA